MTPLGHKEEDEVLRMILVENGNTRKKGEFYGRDGYSEGTKRENFSIY